MQFIPYLVMTERIIEYSLSYLFDKPEMKVSWSISTCSNFSLDSGVRFSVKQAFKVSIAEPSSGIPKYGSRSLKTLSTP